MNSVLRASLSLLAVIAMMISPALCPCLAGELNPAPRTTAATSTASGPVHSCCRNKSGPSEQTRTKTPTADSSPTKPVAPSAPGSGCLCQAHASSACLESRDLPVHVSPDFSHALVQLFASVEMVMPAMTGDFQFPARHLPPAPADQSLLRQHCLSTV